MQPRLLEHSRHMQSARSPATKGPSYVHMPKVSEQVATACPVQPAFGAPAKRACQGKSPSGKSKCIVCVVYDACSPMGQNRLKFPAFDDAGPPSCIHRSALGNARLHSSQKL
eukprot:6212677-Pleurochrysis_carterae.AAC.5